MNCEEFELIGLGGHTRLGSASAAAEQAAASEHVAHCSRCAALAASWQEARSGLRELREATQSARAPQRVEMQLRIEFANRHRSWWTRSNAIFAAWVLAAATVLFVGVSYWNWRLSQLRPTSTAQNQNVGTNYSGGDSTDAVLVADNDTEDFTMLPGSIPQEADDAAIVRVRMQRGALGWLGLPVNEDRLSDWIQVDLLVGQDGQPKAVRLPESAQTESGEASF